MRGTGFCMRRCVLACAVPAAFVAWIGCGEIIGVAPHDGGESDAGSPEGASAGESGAEDAAHDAVAASDAGADGGACVPLAPGKSRFVFVTKAQYKPGMHFESVADADALCMNAASAATSVLAIRDACFVAWMSDGTTSPKTTFVRGTAQYVRTDLKPIANAWTDFASDTHLVNLDVGEDGLKVADGNTSVWTGTETSGDSSTAGEHCNGWTSTSGTVAGGTGSMSQANSGWSAGTAVSCNGAGHIYCVQK